MIFGDRDRNSLRGLRQRTDSGLVQTKRIPSKADSGDLRVVRPSLAEQKKILVSPLCQLRAQRAEVRRGMEGNRRSDLHGSAERLMHR